MSDLALLCAIGLAGLFGLAAIGKFRARVGFIDTLKSLGFPANSRVAISFALPFVELVIAGTLLVPRWRPVGACFSAAVLVVFTVSLLRLRNLAFAPSCHCFGGSSPGRPPGWIDIARNTGLLVAATLVIAKGRESSPFMGWLVRLEGPASVAAGLLAALGLLVVLLVFLVREIVRQQGRILERIQSVESSKSRAGVRDVALLGEISFRDLDGNSRKLDSLFPGTTVFVLAAECSPCHEFLAPLQDWSRASDRTRRFSVLVQDVSFGRHIVASGIDVDVFVDSDGSALEALGVEATPSAFRIPHPPNRVLEIDVGLGASMRLLREGLDDVSTREFGESKHDAAILV